MDFDRLARSLPGRDSEPNPVVTYGSQCLSSLQCSLGALRTPRPSSAFRRRRAGLAGGRTPFGAVIPGDGFQTIYECTGLAGVVEQVLTTGISSSLSLYNTAIIVRILFTWFPQAPPALVSPFACGARPKTLCDPYLNLFRGIIPPIGGTLDLSPILAFITLDLLQNTAAALPCEMPADVAQPQGGRRLAGRRGRLQRQQQQRP